MKTRRQPAPPPEICKRIGRLGGPIADLSRSRPTLSTILQWASEVIIRGISQQVENPYGLAMNAERARA